MRYFIASFMAALMLFLLHTEDDIDDYISEEFNHIQNLDSSYNFCLQKLQDPGNFDIVHIGDSHIEMAAFTTGMLAIFKQHGSHFQEGWFLPPFGFETICQKKDYYRLIDIKRNQEINGLTGRHILLSTGEKRISLRRQNDIRELAFILESTEKPLKVKCQDREYHLNHGSSGLRVEQLKIDKKTKEVNLRFKLASKETAILYGIKINKPKKTYSNFGVSASTFDEFFSAAKLEKQIALLQPNLIVVSLGTNDSYSPNYDSITFTRRLIHFQQILSKFKETKAVFMTVPDTYFELKNPPHLEQINRILRRFCREQKIALWDWNAIMGGKGSMILWEKSRFSNGDYLHFSKPVYQKFGVLFGEALLQAKAEK